MDRHQFDGGHPQRLQIRYFFDHAQIAARMIDLARRRLRKSAHVHFINHRLGQFAPQMAISLPIELFVDDHALWRADDSVVGRQERSGERACVGIDQPRGAVESLAASRIVGTIGLQMIELTGSQPGNEHVPDVAPAVGFTIEDDDLGGFAVGDFVVQQHAHRSRRAAEDAELHAVVMQDRAIRQRVAELQCGMSVQHEHCGHSGVVAVCLHRTTKQTYHSPRRNV